MTILYLILILITVSSLFIDDIVDFLSTFEWPLDDDCPPDFIHTNIASNLTA